MGIRNFFYSDFKKYFRPVVEKRIQGKRYNIIILEINGIFYTSVNTALDRSHNNIDIFKKICEKLKYIIKNLVEEQLLDGQNTKVFLVMEGLSPSLKLMTQRKRRILNMMKRTLNGKNSFDFNNLSVGTLFINYLSKYIDWYLKKSINEGELPQDFDYYFSNQKIKGEGEYKSSVFIKKFANSTDRILIYSNDSDWILNSLLLSTYDITIMRNYVDKQLMSEYISNKELIRSLYEKYSFNDDEQFLKDIYVMCIFLGNDYISANPDISNFDVLLHKLLPIYKSMKKHITRKDKLDVKNLKELTVKFYNQNYSVNDEIMYSKDTTNINMVCDYLYLIETILKMNSLNQFDDTFYYIHDNCPSLLSFQYVSDSIDLDKVRNNQVNEVNPYIRLLSILPRSSYYLLPKSLQHFESNDERENRVLYNIENCEISFLPGQVSQEFEKIKRIEDFYKENVYKLTDDERSRISQGKLFRYKYNKENIARHVYSYYGNLQENYVQISTIF